MGQKTVKSHNAKKWELILIWKISAITMMSQIINRKAKYTKESIQFVKMKFFKIVHIPSSLM